MEIRRADDGFLTRTDGILTRHAFSFGAHFDPDNARFGRLVAHNEERLEPGAGYEPHRHAGLEILSRVLEGELTHTDSLGRSSRLGPGTWQWLSAGSGVEHSERNEGDHPVRFLQMWLLAEDPDADPAYQQTSEPEVRVDRSARVRAVPLARGAHLTLPEGMAVHVSVARGSLDGEIGPGDTLRTTAGGVLTAVEPSEILVWEMED